MKTTPHDKEETARKKKSRSGLSFTIRGVVKLADWADEESRSELVFITSEGEEVLLVSQKNNISLSDLVDSLVEASGRISARDGQKTIRLQRVKVVESLPSRDREEISEDDEQIRPEIAVEDELIGEYSRQATGR